MERWKKAVIHLECATDSEHADERFKRIEELSQKLNAGEITIEDNAKQMSGKSRDIRSQGTAVFIEYNNNHYLVTAHHVLWNEYVAKRTEEKEEEDLKRWGSNIPPEVLELAKQKILNEIYNIIFRVPSLDEALKGIKSIGAFLMNLGTGPQTFTFLPEYDLAVISFKNRNRRFLDELISLGYEPISFNDIEDSPTTEGADIFTVGFPEISTLGERNLSEGEINWASNDYSLPAFSFGRISMLHEHLYYFWADLSAYPGNSGGPVLENDKLVGIVSGQASTLIDESKDNLRIRIPFANIIKAKHVKELILIQEQKDIDNAKFAFKFPLQT